MEEILKRIIDIAVPEKIILFGSYAYGIPNLDSDIDIIVVKKDIESKIREYSKIRRSLRGLGYPFDIIILTPEEFEYYSSDWINSVAAEAKIGGLFFMKNKREYEVLYELGIEDLKLEVENYKP
ncbi:MAG: nucleotidyltransferase domain-containing protein [Thermodesulfovibrionales bacterium]